MNQKKYPVRKEFRMTPQEEEMLKKKAKDMNMTESEYMRLLISQKPMDYMEIRVLLKNLINEVNSVGININQITRNANAYYIGPDDVQRLQAYASGIRNAVREVNKTLNNWNK